VEDEVISRKRLAEIEAIPNEAIDTSDIPEADRRWFQRARRCEPRPWGGKNVLNGYVPGLSPSLDMFALIVSLSQSQVELANGLLLVMKLIRLLAFLWVGCALCWVSRLL
jgi:hypothetical protein